MDAFSIVFVCTGNRFRSPLAAALLHQVTLGMPVEVASRGVLELRAAAALPEALELARWSGIDLSRHRTAQLDASTVSAADLVLGFEQAHVRFAVVEADAPRERTFTLPEFVSVAEGTNKPPAAPLAARARAVVALAAARREHEPHAAKAPDVIDPLGRSRRAQSEIAANVHELTMRLALALFDIDARERWPSVQAVTTGRRRLFRRRSATGR